ncbi:MAG TPA: PadR family transcriptional regulator [Acidimicrobiales bacterium]|nr:PadR family transcriptional regulator [Acidimicrobiales bacterium]
MLDLAILGLLKEQDLHGYELKKRLSDTLGLASGVSFGSLYPALARLERAGAVATSEVAEAALGTRRRKVYVITERGHALFDELLATDAASIEDSRLFHLRLAFARYLPAEARLGMLEWRRAQLLERLRQSGGGGRVGRLADRYVRSLIEHQREATEHDLSWIERLIAAERGSRVLSAPDGPTASSLRRRPPPTAPSPTAAVRTAVADPAPPSLTGLAARLIHQEEPHS